MIAPIRRILALVLAATTLQQPTAEEVSIVLPAPDWEPRGAGRSILINPFSSEPAPGLFFGSNKATATSVPLVRLTPRDSGSSSFLVEPIDYSLSLVDGLAFNPGEAIYVAGIETNVWKVRNSSVADQGDAGTWFDSDAFFISSTTTQVKGKTSTTTTTVFNSRATGIVTDSDGINPGIVYVCGRADDGQTMSGKRSAYSSHWIVRRKAPGESWATVYDAKAADTFSTPSAMCYFRGKLSDPTLKPAVFAVGIFNDKWSIIRSQNNGINWARVDYGPEDGSMAQAFDAACSPNGDIYVAGARGRDGELRGWLLRWSEDGGQTWNTLLDEADGYQNTCWASGIAAEADGSITLTGCITSSSNAPLWAVVRNTGNQSWADSWNNRSFPLGGTRSRGRQVTVSPGGGLFLSGDIQEVQDGGLVTYVGLLNMVP